MSKTKTSISYYSLLFLLVCFNLQARNMCGQALSVNVSQLNFGSTNELTSTSRSIIISNTLNRTVQVTDIRFYNTYGAPAFSASSTSFSIAAGGSQSINILFSPRHNIYHNSEMVILNDGLRGTVSVDLIGQGTYSKSYYANSENKVEEDLKTSLKSITGNGYVSLIYGPARDEMFMVIDNQQLNGQGALQNTIESIYTGALAVGYSSRTDAQTTFLFNTEHTFPQSFFTSLEPMKSDLHHLFPTDDVSNGIRDNDPFGVVTSPSWTDGGSKSNGTIFEPRDSQKGRSARAMFYFVTRYQNYSNFLDSQEVILRTWNNNFPPDAIEVKRNDDIFSYQHNRNPFIDYPQFVERITSLSNNSIAPVLSSLDVIQDTMIYGSVTAGIAADYRFTVVNRGNTTITLSQFSLSQPTLFSFVSGGNDTTISPGESLGLNIRFLSSTADSVRARLNFQSNVPGLSQVTVPIFVNDLIFNTVSEIGTSSISLFPNPVFDRLQLNLFPTLTEESTIELYSMRGEMLKKMNLSNEGSRIQIEISEFAAGPYLLKWYNHDSGRMVVKRFIKMQ